MFKNASAWKEIASPPSEMIKQQKDVLSARLAFDKLISMQPFVISKSPKIMPFERSRSSLKTEKIEIRGLKIPSEEKTSVTTKKIVINPPTSKIELIPSIMVFERMSLSLCFVSVDFWGKFLTSFGTYFR